MVHIVQNTPRAVAIRGAALALGLVLFAVFAGGAPRAETPAVETVLALKRADPAHADHIDTVARVVGAFTCPLADASVAIVDNPRLDDLAEARRDTGGRLSIHYRLDGMVRFQVSTVVFWLMHECVHHRQGDTRAAAARMRGRARIEAERRADCRAIQRMIVLDLVPPGGLTRIDRDLSALRGGGFYASGPKRADYVLRCAEAALSGAAPD